MTPPIVLGLGVMGDVCATSSGWLVTYRILGGPLVVVSLDRDGAELARTSIPISNVEGSTFPRLTVFDGVAFLAYPAWRNDAWWAIVRWLTPLLTLGPEQLTGGVHPADHPLGNCPVCLSPDGWFAWQDADTRTVEGVRLDSGEQRTLRSEVRPTGLATCARGAVVFVDDIRMSVPDMANPVTAGACTVGENLTGGVRVLMVDGRQRVLLSGDTFVPRVADGGADAYAAVTWGLPGVQLVLFQGADIVPVDIPPPVNLPPPPPPPPPPKPEPIPAPALPDPPIPQEPRMVYIDNGEPNLKAVVCEEIDNGNGTFSYRQVNDGAMFTVDDQLYIGPHHGEPGQPFQSFFKTASALVADRTIVGTPIRHARNLPYTEVK